MDAPEQRSDPVPKIPWKRHPRILRQPARDGPFKAGSEAAALRVETSNHQIVDDDAIRIDQPNQVPTAKMRAGTLEFASPAISMAAPKRTESRSRSTRPHSASSVLRSYDVRNRRTAAAAARPQVSAPQNPTYPRAHSRCDAGWPVVMTCSANRHSFWCFTESGFA